MGWLQKALFGISINETLVSTRGFDVPDSLVRNRIEQIGASFVNGYNAALYDNQMLNLLSVIESNVNELQGFTFEGAAMGLALTDFFAPWRPRRWLQLANGLGKQHVYLIYVGAGWALARLPISVNKMLTGLHPLFRWLLVDGYGFHDGYFYPEKTIRLQQYPKRISGYACSVFDQGIGRSLWFVEGADATRIAQTIQSFSITRHADLWSGVGLAAAYAGGVDEHMLIALTEFAGQYHAALAQGVCFAAKARLLADFLPDHTVLACSVICDRTVEIAAQFTDLALIDLPADSEQLTAYEVWRQRIQANF